MRILTITADYPPYHSGGYGIRIKNIMDGLFARGCEIIVLTTKEKGVKTEAAIELPYPVYRSLHHHYKTRSFPHEVLIDVQDVNTLNKTIRKFKPDLIYLGHIYPLTKQILPFLSTLDIPIVCDEGGNSLKGAWIEHGRWFRFTGDYQPRYPWLSKLKPIVIQAVKVLSRGRIKEEWGWPGNLSAIFNSKRNQSFVLGLGIPIQHSQVIYSGIDTRIFTFRPREALKKPLRIICPGRIESRKGQLDAIRLMGLLKNESICANLIIAGDVVSADYQQAILEEIRQKNLEERVQILPMISQEELAKLYHQACICFFTSYQELGLSRIPLEAMACGCVLLSYGNEGSDEIVQDGSNGFLIPEGDVNFAKETVKRLVNSPDLVAQVAQDARNYIENHHSMTAYVDQIETFLSDVLKVEVSP